MNEPPIMLNYRIAEGACIDRSAPLSFRFNGKRYQGYAGDTLASALLANGVRVVGRSFKYHRPRGIVGLGAEEPNAIVQVGASAHTTPGLRATDVELYEGLTATTPRGWPSVNFDLLAVNNLLAPLLSAGFYYKTFMAPRWLWRWYEHVLRAASGLGRAPQQPDPDGYEHYNAHCDVLVAGGGPTGIMAALAAAKCGARVILADEQSKLGGSLIGSGASLNGNGADVWLRKALAQLKQCSNAVVLRRTTVLGYHDHNFLTLLERRWPSGKPGCTGALQRLWRVRARRVVLAQGSYERPLIFPDNDRPGVMLASALSGYIRRYGVCPGRRVVIFTNNDSAYQTVLDLQEAGVSVVAVVDVRASVSRAIVDRLRVAEIPILPAHAITGLRGGKRVRSVQVTPLAADGRELKGASRTLSCDLLVTSGGWNPAVHLHSQAGGRIHWDEARSCFIPGDAHQQHISVGACNGSFALANCLEEGKQAGLQAAKTSGFEPAPFSTPEVDAPPYTQTGIVQPLWRVPLPGHPARYPKQFIDCQNDTTVADIFQAVSEGFHNVEHVKRYTALGLGTDQGKLGNVNGLAVLAQCLDKPIEQVGTTTFRPPYTAVNFGACAGADVGALYEPVRKTALHPWHETNRALFEPVGQWLRPWYFPKGDEDLQAAVARECLAVRHAVGIMDASTLGKIEVQGPDALDFLERIYTHRVGRLRPGQCSYGMMLGEDGMVMDDGICARLGEQHFYLTTTTGGAAQVLGWMEQWLQTEWPSLQVYLTSVTERWATIVLAGPHSLKLLQKAGLKLEPTQVDFPFMAVRNAVLGGLEARLFRVSFSGELAYEINVQADYSNALWEVLMAAGEEYGITPYGTETMHVLRAEKGFIIVGQDTDGSVTPVDLGMKWLLCEEKDYLGKRSLARPDCQRPDRKQLVGLLGDGHAEVLPEGTQLVARPGERPPITALGHVSSAYHSAALGHPIALALVSAGRRRKGERIYAALRDGRCLPVRIVSPVFYDPKGTRQNV